MRSPQSFSLGPALALAAMLSATPFSAAADAAVDEFLPAPDQTGFVGFASTRTPGPWGVDGTLWLDYGLRTYELRGVVPVRHRLSATAIAQLGILSRGAVALRMPVALVQRGDDPQLESVAAGNPAIDARVRVYGAGVRTDGSVPDGAALALRGVFHVPVGTSDADFADEELRAELSAIWDIEIFGIGAGASLGYRFRADSAIDDALSEPAPSGFASGGGPSQHALRFSVGVRLPLPLLSRVFPGQVQETALLEADIGLPLEDLDKSRTPVDGRLGYRLVFGDFYSTLGVSAGLTEAYGNPDFRALLGLGWSPRQHDQDADGVPDGRDHCIHLPEDRDGHEDGDGCADDDNDGDLIVDEDDRCPLAPAEMDRDDDEDGCTDA